jgi:hypothetical protein
VALGRWHRLRAQQSRKSFQTLRSMAN